MAAKATLRPTRAPASFGSPARWPARTGRHGRRGCQTWHKRRGGRRMSPYSSGGASAGAGTRAKRQGEAKASQEEDPKVGRGDGHIFGGRQNRQGSRMLVQQHAREAGMRAETSRARAHHRRGQQSAATHVGSQKARRHGGASRLGPESLLPI